MCNLYWYIRQWFWWHSMMNESQCKQSRTDKSLFSFLYCTYNELLSERKCQPILKYIVSVNDVYYWVVFLLVSISNAKQILNFLFVWVHGKLNRKKKIFSNFPQFNLRFFFFFCLPWPFHFYSNDLSFSYFFDFLDFFCDGSITFALSFYLIIIELRGKFAKSLKKCGGFKVNRILFLIN